MKKWLPTALIASTLLGSGYMTTIANAQGNIPVYYNGNLMTFDVAPMAINGRTMVEFRPLFKQFGYTDIEWNPSLQMVTAKKGWTTIQLQIGNTSAYVNGVTKTLDVAPQVVNGRTLVPLRFISDASGKYVRWNPDTRTVTVSDTPPSNMPPPSASQTQSSQAYYPPLVSVNNLPAIITNKDQWDQAIAAHISNAEKAFTLIESFDPSKQSVLDYSTDVFFKYGLGVWYSTVLSYDPDGTIPRVFTVSLDPDNSDTNAQLAYSLQMAKEIDAQILTPSMTDLQKEKAINDYVVDHLEYDFTYQNHDAYQALTTGKAVCDGYASLTNLLLDQAEIPNYMVIGQDHSWNEVYIQGQWYYLDTTWDDPVAPDGSTADQIAEIKKEYKYDYFNRTDSDITDGDIQSAHTIKDRSLYPTTASTDLNPYKQVQ